ncbi:MAG: nucleotide-binding protein [Burkholderiales bacterium]
MAKPRKTEPPKSAQLTVDVMRAAIPKLERRIKDLESFDVNTIRNRWDPVMGALESKVNSTLQDILGHGTVDYNEYSIHSLDTLPLIMGGGPDPLPVVIEGYKHGIERAVLNLKALKELFEERIIDSSTENHLENFSNSTNQPLNSRQVFVVHGHDEGKKEMVARFLSQIGLEPIILHEQPNKGHPVIEKFEAHSQVAYAVVLFTPDDFGYPADNPSLGRLRARQNVILELGFFLGALGRGKVCVLHDGDIEIPSDYKGVLFVKLDAGGAWKLSFAREMKVAGLDIDLNKVI